MVKLAVNLLQEKNGQVSSKFAAAKNGQVSRKFAAVKKTVKIAVNLLQ